MTPLHAFELGAAAGLVAARIIDPIARRLVRWTVDHLPDRAFKVLLRFVIKWLPKEGD